jgi:hypothetical protein
VHSPLAPVFLLNEVKEIRLASEAISVPIP